ncbi:MAG TPA: hypothetical protein VI193_03775 [Acidimicrobiia bacterium]
MLTHLALRLGHGFGMRWHGMALRWVAVLALLFFIALLVAGVVLLFRQSSTKSANSFPPMDQALITIRMRYAQGEMTTQEFLEANEALGGRPPTPPPPPPAPPA